MQLKTIRIALYLAIALILCGGAGYMALTRFAGTGGQASGLVPPTSLIGGAFTLTDTKGQTVTEKDLLGHPTLMFFGYTFCPDVCPTTLSDATGWLKSLGNDGSKLRMYFVTIDPERDTPAKMGEYLSVFDPRIQGLSGTPDQTAQIIKAYRVFARKVDQKSSTDYLMDHTAAVYMMDSQGRFVGALNYQESDDKALVKLRDLVTHG